jgi:hypothetical protein
MINIVAVMPELSNLVSKVTKLNGTRPRKVAAFIGAITGDAAALYIWNGSMIKKN